MSRQDKTIIRRLVEGVPSPKIAGIALAGVAATLAAAAFAVTAGGQAPQGRTLQLAQIQKGASFRFVDHPPRTRLNRQGDPRRVSEGDAYVASFPVVDSRRRPAGRLAVNCVITRPGTVSRTLYVCEGGFALKDGTITISGVTPDIFAAFTFVVTGGTRAYVGARGTSRVDNEQRNTIELLP